MNLFRDSNQPRGAKRAFARVDRFLDESASGKAHVYSIPSYLVIGPKNSGKSTLIKKSNLESVLHFREDSPEVSISLLPGAILFDVNGSLIAEREPAQTRVADWKHLLQLLVKRRPKRPLNGVVVTIPAGDLVQPNGEPLESTAQLEATARTMRARLSECQRATGLTLPIYVIITKGDQIEYFQDYFRPFPASVENDIFGWSSPYPVEYDFSDEWIEQAFTDLKNHLEQRTMEVLGERRLTQPPEGFLLFPGSFSQLRRGAGAFCKVLFEENVYEHSFQFRGLYFTGDLDAAPTREEPTPGPLPEFRDRFSRGARLKRLDEIARPAANPRLLFVRDLFEKKIFAESQLAAPIDTRAQPWRTPKKSLVAGCVVAGLLWSIGIGSGYVRMNADAYVLRSHLTKREGQRSRSRRGTSPDEVNDLAELNRRLSRHPFLHWAFPVSWVDRLIPSDSPLASQSVFATVSKRLVDSSVKPLLETLHQDLRIVSKNLSNQPVDEGLADAGTQFRSARNYLDEWIDLAQADREFQNLTASGTGKLEELLDLERYVHPQRAPMIKIIDSFNPLLQRAILDATGPSEQLNSPDFRKKLAGNLIQKFSAACDAIFTANPFKSFFSTLERALENAAQMNPSPNARPDAFRQSSVQKIIQPFLLRLGEVTNQTAVIYLQAIQSSEVRDIEPITDLITSVATNRTHLTADLDLRLGEVATNKFLSFRTALTNIGIQSYFTFPTNHGPVTPSPQFRSFITILEQIDAGLPARRGPAASESRPQLLPTRQMAVRAHAALTNFQAQASQATLPSYDQMLKAGEILLDCALAEQLLVVQAQDASATNDFLLADQERTLAADLRDLPGNLSLFNEVIQICETLGLSSRREAEDALWGHFQKIFSRLEVLLDQEGLYKPGYTSGDNVPLIRARLSYMASNFASPLITQIQLTKRKPSARLQPTLARWIQLLNAFEALPLQTPNNPLLRIEDYIRLSTKPVESTADLASLADLNFYFEKRKATTEPSDFPVSYWTAWKESARTRLAAERSNPFALYRAIQNLFTSRIAGRFPFSSRTNIPEEAAAETDLASLFEYVDQFRRLNPTQSLGQFAGVANRSQLEEMETFVAALERVRPWFNLDPKRRVLFEPFKLGSDTVSVLFSNGDNYQPVLRWPPLEWDQLGSNAVREVFIRVSGTAPLKRAAQNARLGKSDFNFYDTYFDGTQMIFRMNLTKAHERYFPIYLAQQFAMQNELNLAAVPLRFETSAGIFDTVLTLAERKTLVPLDFPVKVPQSLFESAYP